MSETQTFHPEKLKQTTRIIGGVEVHGYTPQILDVYLDEG